MSFENYISDIAFSRAVKAVQSRLGSRPAYARMEQGGGWQHEISAALAVFIGEQNSVFLATANAAGQPYIQHRGGPAGFLRVLDQRTIGFADFAGNRQFISMGNLSENPKAHLFLMDYVQQQRIKIWGTIQVVEGDPTLIELMMPAAYEARAERVFLLTVEAWDANCPQHIPQRIPVEEVEKMAVSLKQSEQRIALLEAELARLRSGHASET